MGKKAKAPKPPDYGPLIEASTKAADQSFQLAQEQFAWAKETYAQDKQITDKTVDAFLDAMEFNKANAEKDRARYESVFQPLEDKLIADAESYDTPERRAQEMGMAKADVAQSFEAARDNATRELEGYGINPSATRFAALDLGVRVEQAKVQAAAGTNAGRYVDDKARALRAQAIDIGKGLPAQAIASSAQGNASGAGAGGATLGQTASGASTMGTPTAWMSAGNSALGAWGNSLNAGYDAAMKAYEANKSSSSGIGGLLGTVAGAAFGSPWVGSALGFEDGGVVPKYETGGAIPRHASPTGGAIPDDVAARLTPGEFVIPAEAVRWKGEEFFHRLVEKTAKDRVETTQRTGATPSAIPAG